MSKVTVEMPLGEPFIYLQSYSEGSHRKILRRYKKAGANVIDLEGNKDCTEFINVSKNDALAWPSKVHREYPSTVNTRMESTIKPFIVKSEQIIARIIDVFNDKLGLPKGALARRHRIEESSGCHSRCIKVPPLKGSAPDKLALSAHTDFGSLVSTFCWDFRPFGE